MPTALDICVTSKHTCCTGFCHILPNTSLVNAQKMNKFCSLTWTFFRATIVPFGWQRARKTVLNCPRPIFFSISKFASRQKTSSEGGGILAGGIMGYVSLEGCCTTSAAATLPAAPPYSIDSIDNITFTVSRIDLGDVSTDNGQS